MTEAMPFLQKYDITFLRPPTIRGGLFFVVGGTDADRDTPARPRDTRYKGGTDADRDTPARPRDTRYKGGTPREYSGRP